MSEEVVPGPRLLLVVTGQSVPEVQERRGGFPALFRAGVSASASTSAGPRLELVDVTGDPDAASKLDPTRYDGVIVTGSPARIGDRAPWMLRSAELIGRIVTEEVPLLGVCFGHQLLGLALGGEVGQNPPGYEVGTVEVRIDAPPDDPLLGPLPRVMAVNCSHLDAIRDPGPRLQVVGSAAHDPCHLVKAGPVAWGVQFHPEFDRDVAAAYIRARRELITTWRGEGAAEARLARVAETPDAAGLLARFAAICASRAGIGRG